MPDRTWLIRSLLASGAVVAGLTAFALHAGAASDGAWTQFRADVEASCRTAGEAILEAPAITVDPFGSERFGLAVLTGREKGGDAIRSVVCVFDKAKKAAEIGGLLELTAAAADPATPGRADEVGVDAAAPFGGRCAEECEASLSVLSDSDREGMIDLPDRLRRTLAEIGESEGDGGTKIATEVVRLVAEDEPEGEASLQAATALDSGEGECTLRWFGFMEEEVETVGSHRCRITEGEDGTIRVEKLTGERFLVALSPLTDRLSAFVGRSFLSDQPERDYDLTNPVNAGNANFGNVSGLATVSDGQLHLIGGAELGMQPADPNFFSVLSISRR